MLADRRPGTTSPCAKPKLGARGPRRDAHTGTGQLKLPSMNRGFSSYRIPMVAGYRSAVSTYLHAHDMTAPDYGRTTSGCLASVFAFGRSVP